MADLFSDEWMKSFMEQWNAEPELAEKLSAIDFNSVIGYGFDGEDSPRGVLVVENGHAVNSGSYEGAEVYCGRRATQRCAGPVHRCPADAGRACRSAAGDVDPGDLGVTRPRRVPARSPHRQ